MSHQPDQAAQVLANLLTEVKASIATIPDPLNPLRVRLQAAVELAELGHIPRRPLPLRLELEAAVVGAQLDAQSIEQGEPA